MYIILYIREPSTFGEDPVTKWVTQWTVTS